MPDEIDCRDGRRRPCYGFLRFEEADAARYRQVRHRGPSLLNREDIAVGDLVRLADGTTARLRGVVPDYRLMCENVLVFSPDFPPVAEGFEWPASASGIVSVEPAPAESPAGSWRDRSPLL